MRSNERLTIAEDARELVQRYAAVVEQVALLIGQRLRGEAVEAVRIERAEVAEERGDGGLVFRVRVAGEVEEAQHVWERIEHDLGELQRRLPAEQRDTLTNRIDVVLDWTV